MNESTTEQHKQYIEIWSKVVETQMHFNEMCVKSRQLGLAFVAAALGLGIVLLTKGDDFTLDLPGDLRLHVVVLLFIGSALALFAVRHLDVNVYHRMLRGAVQFNEDFEDKYMRQIFPNLRYGMSQSISHYSRYADAGRRLVNGEVEYTGSKKILAGEKIKWFYTSTIVVLCGMAVLTFLVNNLEDSPEGFEVTSEQTMATATSEPAIKIPLDVVIEVSASTRSTIIPARDR